METALENLSKENLLRMIPSMSKDNELLHQERATLSQKRNYLKAQVDMLQRMQFGQKRERFEGDRNQTLLPFQAESAETEQQFELIKEKIEYILKSPNHKGDAKLPSHLPVEQIEIHPEVYLSEMVGTGKEITDLMLSNPKRSGTWKYPIVCLPAISSP